MQVVGTPISQITDINGNTLSYMTINIGIWNMDSTISKNVSLPVGVDNILSLSVTISNDDGDERHPINRSYGSNGLVDGGCILLQGGVNDCTLYLFRRNSGAFDNSNYNDATMNRGRVTIVYKVN